MSSLLALMQMCSSRCLEKMADAPGEQNWTIPKTTLKKGWRTFLRFIEFLSFLFDIIISFISKLRPYPFEHKFY